MDINSELITAVKSMAEELKDANERYTTALADQKAALESRIASLESQTEQFESMIKANERLRMPGISLSKSGDGELVSWGNCAKLITGVAKPGSKASEMGCGREVEMFKEMMDRIDDLPMEMKAAINTATDGGGAFLVPQELMDDIIPELDSFAIAPGLGVRRIDGLSGNVDWPKNQGGVTAVYVNSEEEETGTESTATFSRVPLRPHVLAAFVPLTMGMLTQPSIAIDAWVREEIARKIALREDLSIFLGTGANSEPEGVNGQIPTANVVDWEADLTGTDVRYGASANKQNVSEGLREHVKRVAAADGLAGASRLGFACSVDSQFAIGKTIDADGREIFLNNSQATVEQAMGYPLAASTQLDSGTDTDETIIFGDWAQVINAHWGTMAFAASSETETNFRKLRTTLRAVMAHDVGVLQPSAFAKSSNFDINSPE